MNIKLYLFTKFNWIGNLKVIIGLKTYIIKNLNSFVLQKEIVVPHLITISFFCFGFQVLCFKYVDAYGVKDGSRRVVGLETKNKLK